MSSIYQSKISFQDVPASMRSTVKHSSLFPLRTSKFMRNNRQSKVNLGILSSASLAHLIDPKQSSLESPLLKNIALTHNNKIIINEETLRELEEKYPTDYIAFYAVYGKRESGKSFWCNRTYQLSEVSPNDHHYGNKSLEKGIYFLNVPFTKGDIKIFLLDCTGFEREDLTREEQMRLDTIMLLSSAVLVIPDPNDKECEIMPHATKQFEESQRRLQYFDQDTVKGSNYWPHSCYCLYRGTEPVQKVMDNVGSLFSDYNFSIIHDAKHNKFGGNQDELGRASYLDVDNAINDRYLHHISHVTKDVYEKIWGKKLGNLMQSGRVVSKMLPLFGAALNHREKVPLQKIFDQTTHVLYDDALKRSSIYYDEAIRQSLKDTQMDKALPSSALIYHLNEARDKTYSNFDINSIYIDPDSRYAQDAEIRLEEMLSSQEYKLMDANKKNSIKVLERNMGRDKDQKIESSEDFRKYLKKLRYTEPEIDQGRPEVVIQRLKEACDESKNSIFVFSEEVDKLNELQRTNDKRKNQILSLEKKMRQKEHSSSKTKEDIVILRTKASKLDDQIDRLKKRNQNQQDILDNPDLEQAQKMRVQNMKKTKMELEDRLREEERDRDGFLNWHSNKSNLESQIAIANLVSRIGDKKRQKDKNRDSFYQSQMVSKLVTSGYRGSERRPITETRIKKSRIA